MARRRDPLPRLEGDQRLAAAPRDHAALSASAGTGKTQVLTARVLRLLLAGADPASILCITFTKAGAAEMAERIHGRLARWVRESDDWLAIDLQAIGEGVGTETVERARTLFASVLEATGGGLRIQTIHAFAQSLLAAFPAEAGLVPGFRPLEGREEQQLVRSTLAELLVAAEREGDHGLVRDVQALSLRMGEGGAEAFLQACARAPDAIAEIGSRAGIEARLRQLFDLPVGDIDELIAAACADDAFDLETLRAVAVANRAWGAASGLTACESIAAWLAGHPRSRAASLGDLAKIVLTQKGEPRKPAAGLLRAAPDYEALAGRLADCCMRLIRMRALAGMIATLAAGLRAGQAFARAYVEAKRAQGVADFDDLIRWAERLLGEEGMGEWVRYKLDQRTDHILVDEAQDTNARQWRIVEALTQEYFAGQGGGRRHRTIFTVGDFKQAIFGFQGTDPTQFERARDHFRSRALEARLSAEEEDVPAAELPPDFHDLSMDMSFRSSPEILAVTDRVIGDLGHQALGLVSRPNPHASHHRGRAGSVTLWAPWVAESDEGEEGWVAETTRGYAGALARQIKAWLDAPFRIEKTGKPLRPEDILVLVRRRGDLAGLLVARLHREGVPVAGVDRLRLSAPLAVQDLLAAARFAAQPLDDLNLASLLVSPLFGWSQDDLYAVAAGRDGALWPAVREAASTPEANRAGLLGLLDMADYETPHGFFEAILSGPLDGRRRLLERLGGEARDPIEELLSAALDFQGPATSLQDFLDWFARGDVDIVRDPSAPRDAVRVMTVHGAKGLQAPVVILADACGDPSKGGLGPRLAALPIGPDRDPLPVFRPSADELADPLATLIANQDRRDREEHWRLLYVAMTRAEERLYVGGALPASAKGVPEASWHRAVETALRGLTAAPAEAAWGEALRLGAAPAPAAKARKAEPRSPVLPAWIGAAAPQEARPPRPLAPSAPGEDDAPYPPPGPELRAAAERGKLLHRLFERLPGVPPDRRRALADAWLRHSAGIGDAAARAGLIDDACQVVDDPRFAELFGSDALAEAPVAAVIADGLVVSGTVDRLLVQPGRILVADFKTGRRVPAAASEAPPSHLRQMAAYRAALRVIFPDRTVEAALLYTAAPALLSLPDALLDAHMPAG